MVKKMRAVILAAGMGNRMAHYTHSLPKGMLKIGGRSILQYNIDNLRNAGINDITIITGYKSHIIDFKQVNYVHNSKFAETNMVHTLFCAESLMDQDMIVSYGDIIYEPEVLQKLLQEKNDFSVVIDDNWLELWKQRSENPLHDAETLKLNSEGYIIEIGSIPNDISHIESQYIGLVKFSKDGLILLKLLYDDLRKVRHRKEIIRHRNFDNLYMTDFLQLLIDQGNNVKGVRINNGWIEIDTNNDYDTYQFMYHKGILDRFCDLDKIQSKI
jgi:choline kinase